MKTINRLKNTICILMAAALLLTLSACSSGTQPSQATELTAELGTASYLVAIEDEPDTVDFQCTSIH